MSSSVCASGLVIAIKIMKAIYFASGAVLTVGGLALLQLYGVARRGPLDLDDGKIL